MIAGALATLFTEQPPLRVCTPSAERSVELQWSRSAILTSPDRAWSIQLKPDLKGENNNSSLILVNCKTMAVKIITRITRKASAIWGEGSKDLLIVNEPGAGDMNLEYFKLRFKRSIVIISKSDAPNRALTAALGRMRPSGYEASFRLVKVESFDGKLITLLSSGVFDKKDGGSSIPYCARLTINTIGHVEQIEKVTESTETLNKKCYYYP